MFRSKTYSGDVGYLELHKTNRMRITRLTAIVTIEIGTVLLLLFLSDSTIVFFLGSLTSALVSLCILVDLVRYPLTARFSWILAFNLLFGYGAGAFNTIIRLYMDFGITADQYFGYPAASLSFALAMVIAVSSVLLIVGGTVERPIFSFVPTNLKDTLCNMDITWMLFLLFILIVAHAKGEIGYGGISRLNSHTTTVSVFGALAGTINPVLLAISGYYLAADKVFRFNHKLLIACIFIISLVLLLPQGRRVFVISLIPVAMAFVLANPTIRKISFKWVLWILLGLGLIWFSVTFFFSLRQATYMLGSEAALVDRIDTAFSIQSGTSSADISSKLSDNLRDRTFVLGYLSELIGVGIRKAPLYGECLLHAFLTIVPSVIASPFFDKDKLLLESGDEETVLQTSLGLPLLDQATTPVTTGFGDFQIIGMFLYPLLLVLIYSLSHRLLCAPCKENKFLMLLISFALIRAMFTEEEGITYYLVYVRNLTIIVLFVSFSTRVFTKLMLTGRRVDNKPPFGMPSCHSPTLTRRKYR